MRAASHENENFRGGEDSLTVGQASFSRFFSGSGHHCHHYSLALNTAHRAVRNALEPVLLGLIDELVADVAGLGGEDEKPRSTPKNRPMIDLKTGLRGGTASVNPQEGVILRRLQRAGK